MKELKYLKLFEAFESTKLTKTLGYVDKNGKEQLLKRLKDICSAIDYPFSQLNDSQFQYLPYQRALNLQYEPSKTPCKATSKSEFGGHGIEGETCQNGKIKRMWGSRQRVVDCPHCSGTGIEPEKYQFKIIKFWFNKEGDLITMTGLDNTSKPKLKKILSKFSQNIRDYNLIGDEIFLNRSNSAVSSLQHGDYVLAKIRRHDDPIICLLWKEENRTYLLQDNNQYDGGVPRGEDWRGVAEYSWSITNGEYVSLRKIEPKVKKIIDVEKEIDPFSFNRPISFNYRGEPQLDRYKSNQEVERLVSKAHFALIFNIEDLKKSEFKTQRQIKSEREEVKSGSRLTVKDEDVKKANIQRYMDEIAKRSDIISDVSNLPKVVRRMLGGENVLFFIFYSSSFLRNLSNLADYYVGALEEGVGDYYKTRLSNLITQRYNTVSEDSSKITMNLKEVKEYCLKSDFTEEYQIIEGVEKMSKKVYQMIINSKLECVEDIDILNSKLESLRRIFKDNNRYKLGQLDYVINALLDSSSKDANRYLTNHYSVRDYKSEILKGIDMALKVLDRF